MHVASRVVASCIVAWLLTPAVAGDVVAVEQARPAPATAPQQPDAHQLPNEKDSVKFAVIGDSGTGGRSQYQVGERLGSARARFPFTFAIMLGDNLYGPERPQDYERKFERPYAPLLQAGVKFYAALGNHDDPNQRFYKPFNMGGKRYYSFKMGPVRFFVLDSNYLDQDQLTWLQQELSTAGEDWKISYFHHPLYSSGERHGSEVDLRERLEPLFREHGVSVVFAGHEHFYERIKPQHGIAYFTSGSAAKLRSGNIRRESPLTAKGFDSDHSFMLVEIVRDELHFQTITRTGAVVDSGVVPRVRRESRSSTPVAAGEPPGRPGRREVAAAGAA
jgi:predicted phosphodiesterase